MLESDGQIEERQAEASGDSLGDQGVGEGAGDGAAPFLVHDEVQCHEPEHLEGRQVSSGLVAHGDPIRVSVGGDADVRSVAQDRPAQGAEVFRARLGRVAAEQRVRLGADGRDLRLPRANEIPQDAAAAAVHAVDHGAQGGAADHPEIDHRPQARHVGGEERLATVRDPAGARRPPAQECLDAPGQLGRSAAAERRLDLEAVVLRRIVAGGDADPERCLFRHHLTGDHRRRDRSVGKDRGQMVPLEHRCDGLGEPATQEPDVVSHRYSAARPSILTEQVRDGLCHRAHVGEGEVFGDDAPPAVGPEAYRHRPPDPLRRQAPFGAGVPLTVPHACVSLHLPRPERRSARA